MACYHPIPALQEGSGQPKLWPLRDEGGRPTANLALPCGKCLGCLSARATQWAHRCAHEASQYADNTFLTLTYDDKHLPTNGDLDARALTLFIKRLRKRRSSDSGAIRSDSGANIRYIACGEYGTTTQRPHYHALLFNCAFPEKTKVGKDLYEADILKELWPFGGHTFGTATPAAANYIAQYTLKKQRSNTLGLGHYNNRYVDNEGYIDSDGVWHPALRPAHNRAPPQAFIRMSLKPAIGTEWLKEYATDLQHGYLVENGRKFAIPRTYRTKIKDTNPQLAEDIEIRTYQHRKTLPIEQNPVERRQAAEQIHKRYKELTENRHL